MLEHVPKALDLLHEFFPVRARAVGDVLKEQNKRSARLDQWQERQLAHFVELLIVSAADLERAHLEQRISTLAWIARNLLELSIWIEYCTGSDVNAKLFHDDAMRDMFGWSQAILSMYKKKHGVENQALAGKIQDLVNFADTKGVVALRDDFMKVRDAAAELGRKDDFANFYKLYSKFAHPTAWVVHSASSVEADEDFRDMFFGDGVEMSVTSLGCIRSRLLLSFPEIRPE